MGPGRALGWRLAHVRGLKGSDFHRGEVGGTVGAAGANKAGLGVPVESGNRPAPAGKAAGHDGKSGGEPPSRHPPPRVNEGCRKGGAWEGSRGVKEGAGPLLDNPPQPKRGDSPDGESFGYAATLRAANEKGGERKVGRVRGEGIARSGTGTAKRGDSPGGESLDTRRRRSRRQRRSAGSEGIAKRRNENGQEERGRWEAKSLASRGNASG